MVQIVRIRRRVTGGAGGPPTLKTAELAWNMQDNILYGGKGDDASGNATSIDVLGGSGAYLALLSSLAQTVTGVKTFSAAPRSSVDATDPTDLVRKGQHDLKANTASPALTGTPTAPTPATGDNTTLLATTAFVKAQLYTTTSTSLSAFAAPTGDISNGGFKITNVADPVAGTDAANKQYVDAFSQGLDFKQSVRVATTANITLSGPQTIDGVSAIAGNRVLVKNQTTASQNGIYDVAAGAWARSSDMNVSAEVTSGAICFVEEGTAGGGKQFILTTTGAITLNTTSLTFTLFGGGTTYTAGGGIGLSGADFSVAAGTGLQQDVDGLSISTSYVGQASIATLGTISTGSWNATIIGLNKGGTNADISGFATGAILKKGATAVEAAVPDVDYLTPNSTVDGGTF